MANSKKQAAKKATKKTAKKKAAARTSARPFVGEAATLVEADFERAAAALNCDIAAIKAVCEVESGGRTGFLRDKRPKILFESRWFHKLTGGQFDASHPDISTPTWVRNYKGGAGEFDRLSNAAGLDREAALKSASWGMFQILGVNHGACGFDDVESFVAAISEGEGRHLDAFIGFVKTNRLDDELRDRRWADFARGYNGPGFRANRYDEKLAAAYEKHSDGWVRPSVADIQRALNARGHDLEVDGVTGPATRAAIRDFQREAGLVIDGVAGLQAIAALGLGPTHDPVRVSADLNG